MKRFAIILAGGVGHRAGGSLPKQFVKICGTRMIYRSIQAFMDFDPEIELIVVVHPDFLHKFLNMVKRDLLPWRLNVVNGGATRAESVKSGLLTIMLMSGKSERGDMVVAVHDAARPLVDADLIRRGFEAAAPGIGAVPVTPAINSLRRLAPGAKSVELSERKSMAVDRSEYVEVQTPQVFHLSDLVEPYWNCKNLDAFTDDASLAESAGKKIRLYEGDPLNIKVTNPLDFAIAEALIRAKKKADCQAK